MKCPRCGLFNPDVAQRCDCGYDFESQTVEKSYVAEVRQRRADVGRQRKETWVTTGLRWLARGIGPWRPVTRLWGPPIRLSASDLHQRPCSSKRP